MHSRRFRGDVAARIFLLIGLSASGALAQIQFSDAGFTLDGAPFPIRGVVYSNTPIGSFGGSVMANAGCLYARDFPLIAATGANVVETLARVEPDDRAFAQALETSGLYWVAGFPLDDYHDTRSSLSPDTPNGAALRERIVSDFVSWARLWAEGGRVVAFVFGDHTARGYNTKFAGDTRDFYSLVNDAAARLAAAGVQAPVTTRVADAVDIGDQLLGTDDGGQWATAFWALDQTGRSVLGSALRSVAQRTTKPVLLAGFGVDAFDSPSGSEDAEMQADALGTLVAEIAAADDAPGVRLLGSVYNGFVDEWYRGSTDPLVHGGAVAPGGGAPDGAFNPGWIGLFGAARTGADGLDSLRPRPAYFQLVNLWGGEAPPELVQAGRPVADVGLINSASGFAIIGRGSLVSVRGGGLSPTTRAAPTPSPLPLFLGAVSMCLGGQPAPLYAVSSEEIRAQAPWDLPRGPTSAIVFRGGIASNPATGMLEEAAPGILPGGVFRPGLPCPVNQFNGVRPGEVLEIYGTGLGDVASVAFSGEALSEPALTLTPPRASWRGRELEILYSGLYPGVVGVYQTNVRMPSEDVPALEGQLLLESGGVSSNPYLVKVVGAAEPERFGLDGPYPVEMVVQAGGPERSAQMDVLGAGAFCGLVRFQVEGAPPGVSVRMPVGLPGQSVPITVAADQTSPRATNTPVVVTGFAPGQPNVTRTLQVTVLPASGDIRLQIRSSGWLTGSPSAEFALDDHWLYRSGAGGPQRGINVLTVDADTGVLGELRNFDTWGSDEAVIALENYLLSIADGTLVLLSVADDGSLKLTPNTRRIIRETLGAEMIDLVDYQWSWALMGRRGAVRPIGERAAAGETVEVDRVVSFPLP